MREERLADGVRLILGDCRHVLQSIPDDGTAIVTDPPYGIGQVKGPSGSIVRGRRSLRRNTTPIVGDATPFDPVDLLRFPEVLLWGANHFHRRLPEGGRWLAWDKKAHSTLNDSFSDVEFAWHSRPGASRRFVYLWKGVLQAGEKGTPKYHRAQKPIRLDDLVHRAARDLPGDDRRSVHGRRQHRHCRVAAR